MAPVVEVYQAMRGAAFLVAVTFAAEIGDVRRFDTPRQLMSFLGLVPAESSTGDTIRRKGLTLAGNRRARRALIEAAWTYRYPARVSNTLRARLEGLPKLVRDIAWKAQVRLCARYRRLSARRQRSLLLGSGLLIFATCGVYAIFGLPRSWSFADAKSQAMADLASAINVFKAPLMAITRPAERDEERSAIQAVSASLTQLTIHLDQFERDYGARLDKFGERMDQDSSARFADVAASSTNWSKEPDRRLPPSANLPRSWRGSTNSRRRSWSRLSLPLRSLTLRRDWISWRGRDSSRLHLLLPSLFCWPSRDNRRLWRERGLPREGKLKVVRIGIHGSKKQACGEALSCSLPWRDRRPPCLRNCWLRRLRPCRTSSRAC